MLTTILIQKLVHVHVINNTNFHVYDSKIIFISLAWPIRGLPDNAGPV